MLISIKYKNMDIGLGIIFSFLVIFFIFLIIREVVVWYFKINKILGLLTKIEENTRKDTISASREVEAEEQK